MYVLACKRILYCHKQRELGHPHWVVQIPRLRYCTNAYGYTYSDGNSYVYAYCHCDVHTDCDCNIYAYGYSDIYADGYRYSYVYAHSDCYVYANGDSATKPDGYSDIYADSYRYSDANTDASCADGIECYQHNCQWLYSELDQRQRREQLLVRRRHNEHLCLWHIRAWLPGSQCGQCD